MKHSNIAFFIPHCGCKHTCSFCNQKTISGANSRVSPEEIARACELAKKQIAEPENTEIAFFGGSFTAIDRGYMLSLLEAAKPYADYFSGIRISTRPDAIDGEVLELLKSYNVKSIELGVQSLDNEVLAANERGHTAEDVYRAAELIKKYGFFLGLQMMTGLYKDSKKCVYFTADEFVRLKPATARVYPTVVLKGTKLYELYKSGEYSGFTFDETVEICAGLIELFEKNDISLIRLGLHASDDVKNNMAAGVYHPAFREICESKLFYKSMLLCLDGKKRGDYSLFVPNGCVSKAAGQKRANLYRFEKMGYNITLRENAQLYGRQVEIVNGEK